MEFVVRDTGIGIAPEVQEHIFLPMTKEYRGSTTVYGGVGLGLAICYKLTDYLGGRLEFKSNKGQVRSLNCIWIWSWTMKCQK